MLVVGRETNSLGNLYWITLTGLGGGGGGGGGAITFELWILHFLSKKFKHPSPHILEPLDF